MYSTSPRAKESPSGSKLLSSINALEFSSIVVLFSTVELSPDTSSSEELKVSNGLSYITSLTKLASSFVDFKPESSTCSNSKSVSSTADNRFVSCSSEAFISKGSTESSVEKSSVMEFKLGVVCVVKSSIKPASGSSNKLSPSIIKELSICSISSKEISFSIGSISENVSS